MGIDMGHYQLHTPRPFAVAPLSMPHADCTTTGRLCVIVNMRVVLFLLVWS